MDKALFEAIKNIGNGDYQKGEDFILTLSARLNHARTKHDWSETSLSEAIEALMDECEEVVKAHNEETEEQLIYESFDVATVAARIIADEYQKQDKILSSDKEFLEPSSFRGM